MSLTAAVIRELVAAGLSGDALVSAVERIEADQPVVRTARQERNRRYYLNRLNKTNKRLKTPEQDDITDSPLSLSSLPSVSANEGSEERKEEKKERARPKIAKTLPDDWAPSESHYTLGVELGHSRSAVDGMASEMRDWAKANGHRAIARKADWDATFSGWIRRAKSTGPPGQVKAYTVRDQQKLKSNEAFEALRRKNQLDRENERNRSSREDTGVLPARISDRSADVHRRDSDDAGELPPMGNGTVVRSSAWDTGQVQVYAQHRRNAGGF